MRARATSGRVKQAVLACAVALVVVGAGAWVAMNSGPLGRPSSGNRQDAIDRSEESSSVENKNVSSPGVTAISEKDSSIIPRNQGEAVDDDGQMLWASPTSGPELPLGYVPDGVQLLFAARPAEILADPEGSRVVKALGPGFHALRESWERRTQLRLEEIDQLLVSFVARNEIEPAVVCIVRLENEMATVSRAAQASALVERDGWSFYTPADEHGRIRIIGDSEQVRQIKRQAGSPPTLRRELASLHRMTDRTRHVTVLLAPNFLWGDGRKMFTGSLHRLVEGVEQFLGDGVQAGMISLHFGDLLYGELRLSGTLDMPAHRLAGRISNRLRMLPGQVEEYLLEVQLDPYWRKLALRYGEMVQVLADQTRTAFDSEHAIANFVLPGAAAHNLLLASELALASPSIDDVKVRLTKPNTPRTLEEVLEHRMSIDIPQQSLDEAVNDLLVELRDALPHLALALDIKILGSDLREEGITKNQQIKKFRMQDRSVAEILTGLVIKANPVANVSSPADDQQQLLWVIGPDPGEASKEIILITTRSAASRRQLDLPSVFKP